MKDISEDESQRCFKLSSAEYQYPVGIQDTTFEEN